MVYYVKDTYLYCIKLKHMKTYNDSGYRYWFDTHIKMWTIYPVDAEGNQLSKGAEHYGYREQLKKNYPQLKFTKEEELP